MWLARVYNRRERDLVLALLLLSIIPREDVLRESCDLVEDNFFYDEQGRLVFEQHIFYTWDENAIVPGLPATEDHAETPSSKAARFQVRAWRLVKSPQQVIQKDHATGLYFVTWRDGDSRRCV